MFECLIACDATPISGFYAYKSSFSGGVRVSVGDVLSSNPGAEIVTAPLHHGGPHINTFNYHGTELKSNSYIEDWWRGDYDVTANANLLYAATGDTRRPSMRDAR